MMLKNEINVMTIDDTSLAADSNQLALWPLRLNTATNPSVQSKRLCQAPSANGTILFFKDNYTSQQMKPL